MRAALIAATAAILAISLIRIFIDRGGPYFARPETVYEHVSRERHPTVDDILLCRQAAPLMPRGATVTIVKPSEKPNDDTTHLDTAAGLLADQRVVAPTTRCDFVITIREPLHDPRYRLVRSFPEGDLYSLVR
jgi:hypothetical protein